MADVSTTFTINFEVKNETQKEFQKIKDDFEKLGQQAETVSKGSFKGADKGTNNFSSGFSQMRNYMEGMNKFLTKITDSMKVSKGDNQGFKINMTAFSNAVYEGVSKALKESGGFKVGLDRKSKIDSRMPDRGATVIGDRTTKDLPTTKITPPTPPQENRQKDYWSMAGQEIGNIIGTTLNRNLGEFVKTSTEGFLKFTKSTGEVFNRGFTRFRESVTRKKESLGEAESLGLGGRALKTVLNVTEKVAGGIARTAGQLNVVGTTVGAVVAIPARIISTLATVFKGVTGFVKGVAGEYQERMFEQRQFGATHGVGAFSSSLNLTPEQAQRIGTATGVGGGRLPVAQLTPEQEAYNFSQNQKFINASRGGSADRTNLLIRQQADREQRTGQAGGAFLNVLSLLSPALALGRFATSKFGQVAGPVGMSYGLAKTVGGMIEQKIIAREAGREFDRGEQVDILSKIKGGNLPAETTFQRLKRDKQLGYVEYGMTAPELQQMQYMRTRTGGGQQYIGMMGNQVQQRLMADALMKRYAGYGLATGIGPIQAAAMGGQLERYGMKTAQSFSDISRMGQVAGFQGAMNPEFLDNLLQAVKEGVSLGFKEAPDKIARSMASFVVGMRAQGYTREFAMQAYQRQMQNAQATAEFRPGQANEVATMGVMGTLMRQGIKDPRQAVQRIWEMNQTAEGRQQLAQLGDQGIMSLYADPTMRGMAMLQSGRVQSTAQALAISKGGVGNAWATQQQMNLAERKAGRVLDETAPEDIQKAVATREIRDTYMRNAPEVKNLFETSQKLDSILNGLVSSLSPLSTLITGVANTFVGEIEKLTSKISGLRNIVSQNQANYQGSRQTGNPSTGDDGG